MERRRPERPGHSLQSAALVNEAYLRLVDYERMQWQNRAHFFAVSAQLMRRILVDHARRHNLKRGGGVEHVALEEAAVAGGGQGPDLVALDDAMNTLARIDPRKVQVVEFDLIFGSFALHHTLKYPRARDELLRVLKPGGRLVLVETYGNNPLLNAARVVRRLVSREPAERRSASRSESFRMIP
jgi:SAM-dependent methyltransferase